VRADRDHPASRPAVTENLADISRALREHALGNGAR
jgi:hypothetical protein